MTTPRMHSPRRLIELRARLEPFLLGAVERFVSVNLELCLLIEEIQELEKSDEG